MEGKVFGNKELSSGGTLETELNLLSLKFYFFPPSLGAETFLCICLFGENESLLDACTAFPPQPAAHQQCAQILPTGQQREERQPEPLFLSLKSPTKTSQDKTENGNTWQITWGHYRVAARHQRSSNMIQGGSDHQELQPLVHSHEKAHKGCS